MLGRRAGSPLENPSWLFWFFRANGLDAIYAFKRGGSYLIVDHAGAAERVPTLHQINLRRFAKWWKLLVSCNTQQSTELVKKERSALDLGLPPDDQGRDQSLSMLVREALKDLVARISAEKQALRSSSRHVVSLI